MGEEAQNTLLTLLPQTSRLALPPLEPVLLQRGMVLYEPEEPIDHLYFPNDALVSIVSLGPDGRTIEFVDEFNAATSSVCSQRNSASGGRGCEEMTDD